VPTHRKN